MMDQDNGAPVSESAEPVETSAEQEMSEWEKRLESKGGKASTAAKKGKRLSLSLKKKSRRKKGCLDARRKRRRNRLQLTPQLIERRRERLGAVFIWNYRIAISIQEPRYAPSVGDPSLAEMLAN